MSRLCLQDDWEAESDEEKPAAPATEAPVKKKKSLAERIAEKEVKLLAGGRGAVFCNFWSILPLQRCESSNYNLSNSYFN